MILSKSCTSSSPWFNPRTLRLRPSKRQWCSSMRYLQTRPMVRTRWQTWKSPLRFERCSKFSLIKSLTYRMSWVTLKQSKMYLKTWLNYCAARFQTSTKVVNSRASMAIHVKQLPPAQTITKTCLFRDRAVIIGRVEDLSLARRNLPATTRGLIRLPKLLVSR